MFVLLNRLMAVLALCGAVEADTGIEDADPIELDPLEYVQLEVGNRWTYEHIYLNEVDITEEYVGELFMIPGYPPGYPPDSLRYAENIVTIEITHIEVIDGFEYFVFSEADYAWPPLPKFFWGGKKVRLSDEGVLVFSWDKQDLPFYDVSDEAIAEAIAAPRFHWDEQGIPLYNFGHPSAYTRIQARLSRVSFNLYSMPSVYRTGIVFLQGYGVGQVYIEQEYIGSCGDPIFQNELTPISAVISGREIVHEQVRPFYFSLGSTGVGQVAQVRMGEGFDFSQGTHSEPSNDCELVETYTDDWEDLDLSGFYDSGPSAKLACSTYRYYSALRCSEARVVDLGKRDFRLLISQGIPPDRPLDFATERALYEGHTYAVRSREGGVALLYVFDAEFYLEDYELYKHTYFPPNLEHIAFDWVYYPDGLPDKDTAVQPISWGQLKARPR